VTAQVRAEAMADDHVLVGHHDPAAAYIAWK
jgi:hypothetical protein